MSDQEKLSVLTELMEYEGELTPDMVLSGIDEWDSLSMLSFVAMMEEQFGKNIKGTCLKEQKTIRDLMSLMVK